ncbi:MAG TPA: translation initiation factor IF-2 [Dehalococcoidia bacterium]|nr:translation initiation factor IF-2 [Dehalococcoidia bacterium]
MTSDGRRSAVESRSPAGREGRRGPSRVLVLPQTLTVKHLSELVDQSPIDVIKQLMRNGIMVSMNEVIDHEVASLVTQAFGIRTKVADAPDLGKRLSSEEAGVGGDEGSVTRPPVVTILGHVDHGKTSLLDAIRQAHVAEGEVGGITQHIGAYQIVHGGHQMTFLDTPGHAAFTAIRSRGARVTDIAILVVAADDGLMPQTIEAIDHARAAEVPIIVAINKMDLPGADPERVKRQLSEHGLLVEDWGGDIISVGVSARTGAGLDELLENIQILSEISELKTNPDKPAAGVIIETKLDRRRGPTTTVLVQGGTLRIGDQMVAGSVWGKVRAITNDQGESVKELGPSQPGEVLGFSTLPEAGDLFAVVPTEREARTTATERERQNSAQQAQGRALTLEEVVKQIDIGDIKELNLVLKADVQGSAEAVRQSLEQLTDDEAKVRILHSGVGAINESDVLLASASQAIVIGFNVDDEPGVDRVAERMGVELRHYNIIYRLIEDVELALHGILEPIYTDLVLGRAEVREIFPARRGVRIAGCRVMDGRIARGASVRVMRGTSVVAESTITGLRHFREEVNDANAGTECGILLQGFNEYETGDILEAHRQERAPR